MELVYFGPDTKTLFSQLELAEEGPSVRTEIYYLEDFIFPSPMWVFLWTYNIYKQFWTNSAVSYETPAMVYLDDWSVWKGAPGVGGKPGRG